MKYHLPKTNTSPKGFTLIELLVVIAIIAIISVVGMAVFQGQQRSARDARRRGDVESISQALEANRVATSTTYTALAAAQFAGGVVPTDPSSTNVAPDGTCPGVCKYCVRATQGACVITDTTVAVGAPAAVASWNVCTNLEAGGNYCRGNAQ